MNTRKTTRTSMLRSIATALALLASATFAWAGQASSNASATSNPFGPGTATAGAAYTGGGQGWARTNTRSGNNLNFGQGISFGVDPATGVSFSASNAVAPRFGPAMASNFNLSIGLDGSVANSGGLSVANGGLSRNVHAGGFAGTNHGGSVAGSTAGGDTGRFGSVHARTYSDSKKAARRSWRT